MLQAFAPLYFLIALALDACVAAAARTRPQILDERIRRQLSDALNGTSVSNSSAGALNDRTVVSLALASDKQTYYTTLSVGNISFRTAVDTGSADFWLLSTNCTSSKCSGLPKYPLDYNTTTFAPVNGNNTAFSVHYADTTGASGFVARETVQLDSLRVTNQTLGLMNTSNLTFVDDVNGILGLGFPRLSAIHAAVDTNSTPFFTTLAQEGLLDYPMFGVALTREEPWGTLALGAVDSTYIKNASLIGWNQVVAFEPFVGTTANQSSYLQWAIPLSNITVGAQVFNPIPTYPGAMSNRSIALLDIGTAGIFGPYQDVARIFSAIDTSRMVDESGLWAIPCDTQDTMTFTFNEQNYTLLPSDYIIGPVSSDPALCLSWPQATPPTGAGYDWQLGSAFLRTVYAIFSHGIAGKEPPMIGLYPTRAANATTTPIPQASLSAMFSSLSLTVATQLPNTLLDPPTYTTPPYAFNTSVPTASPVQSDLAAATYRPLLAPGKLAAASGLPLLAPGQVVLTSTNGVVYTSTQPPATATAALGYYPGQRDSSAGETRVVTVAALLLGISLALSLLL